MRDEHQAGGGSTPRQASHLPRLLVKLTAANHQPSDFALAVTSADVDHPAPLSVIGHGAPQTGPPIRQRARAARSLPSAARAAPSQVSV